MANVLGAATVMTWIPRINRIMLYVCLVFLAVCIHTIGDRVNQLARLTSAMIGDMNYLDSRIEAASRKPACACEAGKPK